MGYIIIKGSMADIFSMRKFHEFNSLKSIFLEIVIHRDVKVGVYIHQDEEHSI
jgi:hypothetical protein